jgi:1,4-dihydroxy-2-naphthoyl-CoA hydrolase
MSTQKIWFADPSIADIEWMHKKTLSESLNITITEIGNDYLIGTMPVDERTKQPFGMLHGGASVALAETLGSVASWLVVNPAYFIGVGVEINANHIKGVTGGLVKGICTPVNVKGLNHIWDIKIYDDANELICVSRFTCTIMAKSKIPIRKEAPPIQ